MNPHFIARDGCPACLSTHSETLCAHSYVEPPMSNYIKSFYDATGPGAEFEYLDGARYVLNECTHCGLIYQHEVPAPTLMERLYEHWLEPKAVQRLVARERSAQFYLWCAAEITRVLRFLGRPLEEVKFLDFGMGWGNWCLIAKGFGCEVFGAELSGVRVEHARRIGVEPVPWEQLGQQRFDFINAEQVFEHLANPLETLRHLRRALNPDGIIRINVPSGTDIRRRLATADWLAPPESDRSLNDVAPLQHINCFNFQSLVSMARLAGLEEVKVEADLLQPATTGGKLKSAVRHYVHIVVPRWHEKRRRKSTNLCFRPARQCDTGKKERTIVPKQWAA